MEGGWSEVTLNARDLHSIAEIHGVDHIPYQSTFHTSTDTLHFQRPSEF